MLIFDWITQIQVSLRGASAKEISRDALLEKVSQEREDRNYARRAASAAIFIQVHISPCFCFFFNLLFFYKILRFFDFTYIFYRESGEAITWKGKWLWNFKKNGKVWWKMKLSLWMGNWFPAVFWGLLFSLLHVYQFGVERFSPEK